MLLKDLIKLPEKKEEDKFSPQSSKYMNHGFNYALEQIGNISVCLDVGKTKKLLIDVPLNKSNKYMWFPLTLGDIKHIAQHLADNIREIIKEVKDGRN